MAVIETSGSTRLDVSGTYTLGATSGPVTSVTLKYGGASVVPGQFAGWAPIGAEKTTTGYQVVWKSTGAVSQYIVWTTDPSGNYLSQTANLPAASWTLESLEPIFQQNLNGDGTIGVVMTPIESQGSIRLTLGGDTYFLNPSSGPPGPQLRFAGASVVMGQFGSG